MRIKQANMRLYKAWQGMKSRCNNPNDKDYKHYGGRGITVCEEWVNDSMCFINWALENGYNDNLSIDRIDVNGNYEPNNCRWADTITQARNRRVEKSNKLGIKGVHIDRGKYRAIIYLNNKRIDLGRHETLEEAVQARKEAERTYWKEGQAQ